MCPVCLVVAALVAGKVTGAGGLAAVAVSKFRPRSGAEKAPAPIATAHIKTKEDRNDKQHDFN